MYHGCMVMDSRLYGKIYCCKCNIVKTRIDSNSGASEISCVNGRGFNFDVAPSLVGIWCPLIYRVGDVGVRVRGSE